MYLYSTVHSKATVTGSDSFAADRELRIIETWIFTVVNSEFDNELQACADGEHGLCT